MAAVVSSIDGERGEVGERKREGHDCFWHGETRGRERLGRAWTIRRRARS
jgi:hypothetical protein